MRSSVRQERTRSNRDDASADGERSLSLEQDVWRLSGHAEEYEQSQGKSKKADASVNDCGKHQTIPVNQTEQSRLGLDDGTEESNLWDKTLVPDRAHTLDPPREANVPCGQRTHALGDVTSSSG